MPVDPFSIAAEVAAGVAAEGFRDRVKAWLSRRETRQRFARQLWNALVSDSNGVLRLDAGVFDAAALWSWLNQPDVAEALASNDSNAVGRSFSGLQQCWISSSYERPATLADRHALRAAQLCHQLVVIHACSGPERLELLARRLSDGLTDLHNDLALVCELILSSQVTVEEEAARILSVWTERVLSMATTGIRGPTGPVVLSRQQACQAASDALETAYLSGQPLLLTGDPDLGKSHLASSMASDQREIRDVLALDLRQLPATQAEVEHLLGATLEEALNQYSSDDGPWLVVDGAEQVQMGSVDLLRGVLRAAVPRYRVLLIARRDAESDIRSALQIVGVEASTHQLDPLSDDELVELLRAIPDLRVAATTTFGAWFIRRLGLLEAASEVSSAHGLITLRNEADLVDLLWRKRIRGDSGGQGRVSTVKQIALRLLGVDGASPDDRTVDELRRDGVLALPDRSWSSEVDFAGDFWRDAAMAGALADDPAILGQARYPRIAIRAARFACAVRLGRSLTELPVLLTQFDTLAARTGQQRWREIPLEALCSLGLTQEQWAVVGLGGEALQRLLEIAVRPTNPLVTQAPRMYTALVQTLIDRDAEISGSGLSTATDQFVGRWLEGMVVHASAATDPTRVAVCRHLLDNPPQSHPEHPLQDWLRDLALCCVDLDPDGIEILLTNAESRPSRLDAVFDSVWVSRGLASSNPDLLLALAEKYYIDDHDWISGGVRHSHRRGMWGPDAGAFHTPMLWLLRVRPRATMALVNRIMDHACRVSSASRAFGEPNDSDVGTLVSLELPGRGITYLVGTGNCWSWYRGIVFAPHSCVSMLLAVEVYADELISHSDASVDEITNFLLATAGSLAMTGLAVGIAVRHLDPDSPSQAIRTWLAQPLVWHLEVDRAVSELTPIGRIERNDLVGEDRRTSSFRQVGPTLAFNARLTSNDELAAELEATADVLEAAADGDLTERLWSSELRPSCVSIVLNPDGSRLVTSNPPNDVAEAINALNQQFNAEQEADRIRNRYLLRREQRSPVEDVLQDLERCRSILPDPEFAPEIDEDWRDACAQVAAEAIALAFDGLEGFDANDLSWCVGMALTGAEVTDDSDGTASTQRRSPWRANRTAARVLPLLLLPKRLRAVEALLAARQSDVIAALRNLVEQRASEINWEMFSRSSELWSAPCKPSGECHHRAMVEILRRALDTSVQWQRTRVSNDDWAGYTDEDSSSDGPSPPGPLEQSDRWVHADLLLGPMVALSTALVQRTCQAAPLGQMLDEVLSLHASCFAADEDRHPSTTGDHFPRVGTVRILV